ncbi:uncharacterized protein BO95DRAFT_179777 [Aspergillus brunneoviolaceus CBS 621.78]|uniref:Uncharacterized protein n=1 Tax=Aspergillus brunneoviolaceus CBS 621.78 TaxID=1450534 RepID=A0ACD1G590_9EURO|nr:hypothetical protein BO95DRAFT_179777 [Aspergillus brunneoviolaceus CBS 621.78]RAH44402.1 hypothetical protein BO95DRAFT_179777 [Aspergillus brunneoviolaceus CBS 621.78]
MGATQLPSTELVVSIYGRTARWLLGFAGEVGLSGAYIRGASIIPPDSPFCWSWAWEFHPRMTLTVRICSLHFTPEFMDVLHLACIAVATHVAVLFTPAAQWKEGSNVRWLS